MITEPTYLEADEAGALCTEDSCSVHGDGDTQCPVLFAEVATIEAIRESL